MQGLGTSGPRLRGLTSAAALLVISLVAVGCAAVKSSNPSSSSPSPTPSLSLSATAFDFKTVVVGQTATQSLNISNTGTASVQITGLSMSNPAFSITGPSVPRVVLAGNSLSYTLSFAPTKSGSASATLSITTNASSTPLSVSLTGNGQAAFASLAITPASINFGNITLNTTSRQNVTLQNTGEINLVLQGITLAGSGFGYSNLSTGLSLAPNQTVTFQVWFNPKVAGPASATVTFLSPNLSSSATMSLSGNGVSSTSPTPPPSVQHTVHLTWAASSSQVVGYIVYRRLASAASYSPLNSTPITALSYDDSTVALGTTYDYAVTAIDSSGVESAYSNQVTAVIPSS